MRDSPGRINASPYVKVSSNCLLLRLNGPAVFHTVHYSQPGGLGDQTDNQQGHSAPFLSPAVVVGCKLAHSFRLLRKAVLCNVSLMLSECCFVLSHLKKKKPNKHWLQQSARLRQYCSEDLGLLPLLVPRFFDYCQEI